MKVLKRDGRKVDFEDLRIENAMKKAYKETLKEEPNKEFLSLISSVVANVKAKSEKEELSVEEIQDVVEAKLMASKFKNVAKAYILFRQKRAKARKNTIDDTIKEIVGGVSDYWNNENSNKNAALATTQRDYVAGEVSADATRRYLLPEDIIKAHEEGILHFHDADYFLQRIHNCDLINLEDMLQNGTIISETKIDKPHKFSTACNIATQIIAQVASSQYGGQSISLAHLAPFVNESRNKFYKELKEDLNNNSIPYTEEQLKNLVEERVKKDIRDGVQTIQYQVVTLMTTNGQAPFITVYMNLADVEEGSLREDLAMIIEETLKQRILGVKNKQGVYITPAFPKLIYALDECNIEENSKYFYLTELAAECTAKRMVPDYISNKIERELKNGDTYTCMGCRSFLTPDRFSNTVGNISKAMNFEEHKGHFYFGRFNQGVVTINPIDAAFSSHGNMEEFWRIFDERLELCHKALKCRHNRLLGTSSDIAPILWQNGALARLEKGEKIDPLLYNGYSTISLGYCGIYETTKYMTGHSHTEPEGKEFAMKVMQKMNDKCNEWKVAENIDYSLYGTPLETTTYKFAKCLKKRFPEEWEKLGNRDYVTNSYHVNVREPIDAFTKLKVESEFQKLSPGGAISYVEVPNMANNIPAVIELIKFIYNNIMYAEINSKFDYCQKCGFNGEIEIKGTEGHYYWECPNCGNNDKNLLNIARRTCGYIGTNFWNQGRTEEIKERVLHLDN